MKTDNSNPKKDDVFEVLFRHAEPRPAAPAEDEQLVREALHGEWLQLTRQRRNRNIVWTLGMAASLVLATLFAVQRLDGGGAIVYTPVASIERAIGDYSTDSAESFAGDGYTLYSNQTVSTGPDSRLAIAWHSGQSIRLDRNTSLILLSSIEIELQSGRIYIDTQSKQNSGEPGFIIKTAAGSIRHLGTRYMVDYVDEQLAVSVRAGQVLVATDQSEAIAVKGQRITVAPGGTVSEANIATWGKDWQWTESIAPEFDLDGRTMADFLDWVSRESGRPLQFANSSAEILARGTVLKGSIELEPMRALVVMMQTSDLVLQSSDHAIIVDLP